MKTKQTPNREQTDTKHRQNRETEGKNNIIFPDISTIGVGYRCRSVDNVMWGDINQQLENLCVTSVLHIVLLYIVVLSTAGRFFFVKKFTSICIYFLFLYLLPLSYLKPLQSLNFYN